MDFIDRIKNIGLIALGAIILAVHVVVFRLNQYMFTVIMCIYIIGYTILVIVLMYKNKNCYDNSDFDILINMSAYTLFLELFLILLTLGFYYSKKY
jgi:RsiW-degrading membrane proteinase PrsW (M82 family)